MTYKIVIQVGEKKVMAEVESDEMLGKDDFYVDKVLRKKDNYDVRIGNISIPGLKKMFGI